MFRFALPYVLSIGELLGVSKLYSFLLHCWIVLGYWDFFIILLPQIDALYICYSGMSTWVTEFVEEQ